MTEPQPDAFTLEQCRRFYAEEIRAVADLDAPDLLSAFARVPRERFLGPAPWKIAGESHLSESGYGLSKDPRDLYHNVVVAIKSEQHLNNGQPSALASWIVALDLTPGAHVFHVGCGTGYYTAIMAELVGPGGAILAAEVEPDLAAHATENLREYPYVTIHSGDGARVDPGPRDAIFINAGITHPNVPWLWRLKEGGRMVLPLTVQIEPDVGRGVMVQISRRRDRFPATVVSMVGIYSSASVRDPDIEVILDRALESRELLKLKSVRVDRHDQTDSCIVHAPDVCLSARDD